MLLTLLSELVNFHSFPRDAGRFHKALALVAAAPAAAPGDARGHPLGHGLFAPPAGSSSPSGGGGGGVGSSGGVGDSVGVAATVAAAEAVTRAGDNAWTLLVNRLGTLCLHYVAQLAAVATVAGDDGDSRTGAGGGVLKGVKKVDTMDLDDSAASVGLEVRTAAESAVRVFALLSSPEEWCSRLAVPETAGRADRHADHPCRRFLSSLALGKLLLCPGGGDPGGGGGGGGSSRGGSGDEGGDGGGGKNFGRAVAHADRRKSMRLTVRTERDDVTGDWTRAPRLFGVLRVLWDASGGGDGATGTKSAGTEGAAVTAAAVRLLCAASLEALAVGSGGVGGRGEGGGGGGGVGSEAPPLERSLGRRRRREGEGEVAETLPAAVASETVAVEAAGKPQLDIGRPSCLMRGRRKKVLEAFAAAMLPAPRLLEHPMRALLVDPMLAGDATAWWRLVSMAGDAVGAEKGEGGNEGGGCDAARRRDISWAVSNILQVLLFCFVVSWSRFTSSFGFWQVAGCNCFVLGEWCQLLFLYPYTYVILVDIVICASVVRGEFLCSRQDGCLVAQA